VCQRMLAGIYVSARGDAHVTCECVFTCSRMRVFELMGVISVWGVHVRIYVSSQRSVLCVCVSACVRVVIRKRLGSDWLRFVEWPVSLQQGIR